VVYDLLESKVISGWFMVYMGDEVDDRSVVVHDELGDMGCLVPMK
jgi:hypothetical protein